MEYIAECLEKFRTLDASFREDLGAGQAYEALQRLEEDYKLSLSFIVVLLAVGELDEEDLSEYLQKKFKLEKPKAEGLADRLTKEVFQPALNRFMPILAPETDVTSFDVESVFRDALLDKIEGGIDDIKSFNISVFAALDADPALEEKIISSLYSNKEIITTSDVIIDGRNKKGTIGNWIKLFVAENGSGMFDGLSLAKFLSSSACEKLSDQERNIVSKVLKTYRNLVFFPESMDNVPLELWEVLPVENEQGIADVLADSPVVSQEQLKSKQHLAGQLRERKMEERKAVSAEIEIKTSEEPEERTSTANKLQQALGDYAPGSLEYKVIKQELDRLRMSAASKR